MEPTVGEISRIAGVSVRTLHHYDTVGLVSPTRRSEAGYRLYGPADVERLQEVLFFRELGLPLADIRRLLDEPGADRSAVLARQRRMLERRAGRIAAMIEAVDAAVDARRKGTTMTNEEMLGVFGDFDPAEYAAEAEERWGDTDAYRESARRTAGYTKEDWERLGRESAGIDAAFVALMEAGAPSDGPEAREVAERHRAHISAWFYECTPEIHAGLGQMYLVDERFRERIDRTAPGLAAYMSEAITANAAR
jgi:DNA-binding transcriptional MerR regulator